MRIALKADAEQDLLGAVDAARARRLSNGVRLTAVVDPR